MSVFRPNLGLPRMNTERIARHRTVTSDAYGKFLPGGGIIDGTKARDTGEEDGDTTHLRAGLLMGRITSGGKYANSFFGTTTGALANGATSITVSATEAAEIVRRIGASGNISLTGPASAAGAVRSLTVAYSAVNTTTGVVTITSPTVNEVQTLNFANSPSGAFRLGIIDYTGKLVYTQPITYSATIATLLSNLQTATDAALATNAIVWSGTLVTAVAGTFSGTNYTGVAQPALIRVDTDSLTAGSVSVAQTTAGVSGAFVAGSLVGDTDGSQVPVAFISDGWGELVTVNSAGTGEDQPWARIPYEKLVMDSQLLPWPSDSSLKQYIRDKLKSLGAQFSFSDAYLA